MMSPGLRRLALTAHVASSVGWVGAVAAFLALAVVGLVGREPEKVRGAYLAMAVITWWVILPSSLASLATGIISSVGTKWGLLRHYWVLAKLALTVVATLLLVVHTQPIGQVATLAAERALSSADLPNLRLQLVVDASFALVVLLATTALGVYKPRGMTRYGWEKQREPREPSAVLVS